MVAGGILAPSDAIISVLQGAGAEPSPNLANGTLILKTVLVVFGAYILALKMLPTLAARPDAPKTGRSIGAAEIATFAGLFAIAAALRFYKLDVGIWYDEMLTYVHYMPLTVSEIVSTYKDANNHILFSILARLSLTGIADAVWAFRLPAALFGLGSIVALYLLALRVTSRMEGLFAVALFTFSFHHIWFSQNARGYTALLFFALLSTVFLLDALRTNRTRTWVWYAITAALGAYTHLTMVFPLVAHFIIYVTSQLRRPERRLDQLWGLLFGFVPLGFLILLLYALILPDMLGGGLLKSGLQSKDSDWLNPLWAFMEIVNGLSVGFTGLGAVVAGGVVFLAGSIDYLRKRPEMIGLFYIPTSVGFVLMTSIGYTLFPRFFFFAMGFAVLILFRGAVVCATLATAALGTSDRVRQAMSFALCAAIILASIASLRFVHAPKQMFEAAIGFVEHESQEGDTIVAVGMAGFPFNDYYGKDWKNVRNIEELDALLQETERTWLIYTMPVHAKTAYADILKRVATNYTVVETFTGTLNGGGIVICVENMPR